MEICHWAETKLWALGPPDGDAALSIQGRDHQSKKTIMFAICEICGSVQELVNTGLEHLVRSLEKDIDFLTNRSVIELKGICSTCKD